jgi:phage-related holin
LLTATLCLVGIDLVTGVAKAVKAGGWASIRSRRLRETIGKGFLYLLAILSAFLLDYVVGLDIAARAVAGVIALTEVKSILENVTEMTGVNVISALLAKLKPPPAEPPPEKPRSDSP